MALELEAKGVVGEGLTFSMNEKEVASSIVYEITNHIGSMNNSQLQQASSRSRQLQRNKFEGAELEGIIKILVQALPQMKLSSALEEEVNADIATLESQLGSPRPKMGIIRESLISIRNVLEGGTGSMVASELLTQIQRMM